MFEDVMCAFSGKIQPRIQTTNHKSNYYILSAPLFILRTPVHVVTMSHSQLATLASSNGKSVKYPCEIEGVELYKWVTRWSAIASTYLPKQQLLRRVR